MTAGEPVDLLVVGAGPAGCGAAIAAARRGRSVILVEKAAIGRDKICGDGLTTSALRRLESLGVDVPALPSTQQVSGVCVRGPKGHEVRFPLPTDGWFAAVTMRRELDAALARAATGAGVDLREHTPIERIELREGLGARVQAGGQTIDARAVIAADGMWSPTRRLLGANDPGYRGDWHAFRQYLTGWEGDERELFISFDAAILPGYFWIFPLAGGGLNIGYGIQRGGTHAIRDMGRLWTELLERPEIARRIGGASPAEPHRAWPIPCRVDSTPAAVGPVLFAGDAVAACDVMTGEGIGQALQTGELAAEVLHRWWHDPVAAGAQYERQLRHELVPDHTMSAWLVSALQHRKGVRGALRVAGTNEWTRRNFARWLFEDSPRGIALRPSLWGRGALSGTGAYR